jgi:phage tail sheath gpL-like
LSTLGAILGDKRYSFVGNPYTAAPALTKWQAEFADNPAGRWGYARRLYGGVWSALNDTAANLASFSTANDPHQSIFGIEGCPNPSDEIAAAYCGAVAASLRVDPARPLNTLTLNGILAPHPFDQFTYTDRNLILNNGITTPIIDSAGNVRIQRAVTTYTKNPYGAADASFRDVTTPYTLDFLLTEMENLVTNQYGRVKLVNDGTPVAPGMAVVTPSAIKNALVAAYQGWERLAIVENSAVFVKLLRVERVQTDPTRVNVYFPPDLANGLMIFAALAEFRLNYSPTDMAA